MEPKDVYFTHLDLIDLVSASVCRRNGVFDQEAEDFRSEVRLKLMDQDYAVFRKFRGNSSLATYLTVVVSNLFHDFRVRKWGRWRPSAKARRLGETAVLLETLLYRDGHSFDEACQVVTQRLKVPFDRGALREIVSQLPARWRRRMEGDRELAAIPAADRTNGFLMDQERAAKLRSAEEALDRALATLPAEDRVVIKMQFFEGFSVADIARTLHLDQKPLYERIKRNLERLRAQLESDGVTADLLDFMG